MSDAPQLAKRHEAVDNFISRWHDAPEGEMDGPLHEEMGWTWDEYTLYVTGNVLPEKAEGHRV